MSEFQFKAPSAPNWASEVIVDPMNVWLTVDRQIRLGSITCTSSHKRTVNAPNFGPLNVKKISS